MSVQFRQSRMYCPAHGGIWGTEPSCNRCTDDDGSVMPFRALSTDTFVIDPVTGEVIEASSSRESRKRAVTVAMDATSDAAGADLSAQNPPDGSEPQKRFVVHWSRILGAFVAGFFLAVIITVAWNVAEQNVSACYGLESGPARATCGHGIQVIDTRRDGLPLCATEDSDNCRWRADIQGNGYGASFNRVDGVTEYLD